MTLSEDTREALKEEWSAMNNALSTETGTPMSDDADVEKVANQYLSLQRRMWCDRHLRAWGVRQYLKIDQQLVDLADKEGKTLQEMADYCHKHQPQHQEQLQNEEDDTARTLLAVADPDAGIGAAESDDRSAAGASGASAQWGGQEKRTGLISIEGGRGRRMGNAQIDVQGKRKDKA